jgi:hypothetical protein
MTATLVVGSIVKLRDVVSNRSALRSAGRLPSPEAVGLVVQEESESSSGK